MDVTVAVVDSKIDYKQFQNAQKEAEQNKDKNDVACKSVFVQMAYFSSRGAYDTTVLKTWGCLPQNRRLQPNHITSKSSQVSHMVWFSLSS